MGGGWRFFESDSVEMSDGLVSWVCMGWSSNDSIHGAWWDSGSSVVL